jgi:hypothetical protein
VVTETQCLILAVTVEYVWIITARLADFIALILGGVAVWGLVFKRRQIAYVFRLARNVHLHRGIENVRETLRDLNKLDYREKESRPEIAALLGQLSGQIESLLETHPKLTDVHQKVTDLVEAKKRCSESVKRQICCQLEGILDSMIFEAESTLLGTKDVR